MRKIALFLLCLLLSTFGVGAQDVALPERDYWPTDGWRTSTPAEQGMNAETLAGISEYVEENMPYARSVLVVRHGYIVFEDYFNHFNGARADNVRSVTKSVTSALVGIALANGDIRSLDVTFSSLFPEYFRDGANIRKRNITLRHLLMMRSGLDWEEDVDYIIDLGTGRRDQMQQVIGLPRAYYPGQHWHYSTADSHLVSGIFTRSTGMTLLAYAEKHLFAPMGIAGVEWGTDYAGYSLGGIELSLRARDMARFGYLYLNHGVWNGKQVVPAEWVELTTSPQDDEIWWYGYLWWRGEEEFFGDYPAFVALGYGGEVIFVYPELDMVVVTKASYMVPVDIADAQERALLGLIGEFIIPAVLDAESVQR